MVQIDYLAKPRKSRNLTERIIDESMEMLIHRQYNELAHKLGVSLRKIEQSVKFISENLNPFPGRSHWGDVRHPGENTTQVYHQPDIIINYLNDDPENPLIVEIVMPLKGTLRINPLFQNGTEGKRCGQKRRVAKRY